MSIEQKIEIEKITEDIIVASGKLGVTLDIGEILESWVESGPCCFIANDPFNHKIIYDFFKSHGLGLSFVSSELFVNYLPEFMLSDWSVVIISIDDFEGVSQVFKTLRTIRNDYPEVSVILTSKDFTASDLSKERLAICDVSLRSPCETASLTDAFISAYQNNKAWNERLEYLHGDSHVYSNMTEKRRRRIKYSQSSCLDGRFLNQRSAMSKM